MYLHASRRHEKKKKYVHVEPPDFKIARRDDIFLVFRRRLFFYPDGITLDFSVFRLRSRTISNARKRKKKVSSLRLDLNPVKI